MILVKSYFIKNEDVNIHVLENGTPSDRVPTLVVISGIWEPAERAIPILSGLSSHVIAISLRGRGLSSTPVTGYDLEEHLSDIEAVIKHCNLKNYCMLGFSRGASYALGWSLEHFNDMKGLILVDQPPVHTSQSKEAVEYWCNMVYRGVPLLNFMRREAIEGLAREAVMKDFSSELYKLTLPVMFFAGRDVNSSIPSNVDDEIISLYKNSIPSFEMVEFLQSGHMIPDDEPEKYINEIDKFIKKLS